MTNKELIKSLRDILPEKIRYGVLVGAPYPYNQMGEYVYPNPEDYIIEEAANLLDQLLAFKSYWDDLYGEGLEVANWNYNGTTVPYDDFYESALSEANLE